MFFEFFFSSFFFFCASPPPPAPISDAVAIARVTSIHHWNEMQRSHGELEQRQKKASRKIHFFFFFFFFFFAKRIAPATVDSSKTNGAIANWCGGASARKDRGRHRETETTHLSVFGCWEKEASDFQGRRRTNTGTDQVFETSKQRRSATRKEELRNATGLQHSDVERV
jgi:hypothetical protein